MTITLNHMIVAVSDRHVAGRGSSPVSQGSGPARRSAHSSPCASTTSSRWTSTIATARHPTTSGSSSTTPTFDGIVARVRAGGVEFGSGPLEGWDRGINHLGGGRGVYVRDPDGHSYEFFTAVP